jgi:hypothetical protein
MHRRVPVFFLEVKTYLALHYRSLRMEADNQMRDMFLDFSSGSLPLRKLYGISIACNAPIHRYTLLSR